MQETVEYTNWSQLGRKTSSQSHSPGTRTIRSFTPDTFSIASTFVCEGTRTCRLTSKMADPWDVYLVSCLRVALEVVWVVMLTVARVVVAAYRCLIPSAPKDLRGKVVVVTGAAHGLGKGLAERLAALGAKVVLLDVNKDKNAAVAEDIRQSGGEAWAYDCDVSQENQVTTVAEKISREVGPVCVLLNNAGVLPGKPLMQLGSDQIRRTLNINTLAHMWTIRAFLPGMIDRGEGHIVAIASIAGIIGAANLVDYCASKYAVVGLMSALHEELFEQGLEDAIPLTVICPATMDTGLVQKPKTKFPNFLPVLSAEQVADITMNAVLRNKRLVVIPTSAHVIHKIANLFPIQVPLLLQRYLEYTIDPNV